MLREELKQSKVQLNQWQESWKQAKNACDAWKKEVEEVSKRAQQEKEQVCVPLDDRLLMGHPSPLPSPPLLPSPSHRYRRR